MTPHLTTRETTLCLTYNTEVIISVEVENMSMRMTRFLIKEENNHVVREEIDLLEEKMTSDSFTSATIKQTIASKYNPIVRTRESKTWDFILRRADIKGKSVWDDKLAGNWKGLYHVQVGTGNEAYTLETLVGEQIPRT